MSKLPIFEHLVKTVHVLLQLNFFLLIREYDTVNEFLLHSQKPNPSYDNRGSIYTKYGLLISLKIITNYLLHCNRIGDKYNQKSTEFEGPEASLPLLSVQLSLKTRICVFDFMTIHRVIGITPSGLTVILMTSLKWLLLGNSIFTSCRASISKSIYSSIKVGVKFTCLT